MSAALDIFCPFDAVGMNNQEIRHGFFLRYVLDPARPHGFGAECLRAFMWSAAEATQDDPDGSLKALDVHLMNLDDAIVDREYKSIDLLVQIPSEKVIIAIELKIDAMEHSGQLRRYRRIIRDEYSVSKGWRQLFLFLTKRGDLPSEEDGKGWRSLPLDNVVDALDRVATKGSGQPEARMMLHAYVAMLRRRHLNDQRMEDLARKLWREHGEALDYLISRKPDLSSDVMQFLADRHKDIADRLSGSLKTMIEPEHSAKNELRFGFADWDSIPGMLEGTGWNPSKRLILFMVKREPKSGSFRLQVYLGPGPRERRQALFDSLKAVGARVDGKWGIQESWRQLVVKDIPAPVDDEFVEGFAEKLQAEMQNFLHSFFALYDTAMKRLVEVVT
ncbi:PD-(D/E)XK nuclease family protein [Sphingobium baderi]|uniref:PD-(D/E)XK nuclease family protein n=1 Tax=Sphingobium baderi TaxID=1332080 RepID=UPI002B40649C|nr:PD-(D/E)XK nuclease family protein [Sphingobium baderi]WRD78800.1 PD-(D/E)XK nuclease family protein [Sphingobium baderi]